MNSIVTALFTLTLASWASASAGSVTPKAECKFDKGMCGWRSDPTNPWLITTLNKSTPQFPLPNSSWPILCLSKEVLQEANSGESWFADDVNPSVFKTPQYLIRTRLRSPSVPASLGLRCLTFSSFFNLGRQTPLIKPVAVCNFNDGDTCGWMHEGAIWMHRWEAEQGYLCLKAKMSTFSSKMKTSSWLPGLSTGHRKPSADIRVRFTSSPVPSAFGLKCIAFGYSIGLEQSSSLLKPLAVCDFDDGETCGWVHEEVPWAYRWAIVRDRLCLKAKVPLNSPSKKISSWLRGLAIDQSSDEIDIKVRFSSPPIPASFGVKCVVFVYSMDFGREKTSKPVRASGSLSLLQQQKGYFFIHIQKTPPKPFFVWTFNENTGKWTNDAANWHQKWELINGAICLRNVPSESGESDDTMFWLSLNTVKEDIIRNTKALLWSPPIPQSVGMRCITMDYLIDMFSENSEAHRLAMLQQQTGRSSKTIFRLDLQRKHRKVDQRCCKSASEVGAYEWSHLFTQRTD
uniref:MAM n=1 Tax=Echinococcus granulosus TaxID=6210 RepID=A0A068WII5_ECHGR|nr:MAM [Echinococcus granulosus]